MALVNAFGNPLDVIPANVQTEFRESFETYDTTTVWSQTTGSGDIVQLDGNATSCSYLVISKDPLTAGNETIVETRASFTGPFETAVGLHMSQRALGQETSMELVSTDTPLSSIADLALSSMGSNGTTLYINTVLPHNLSAGQRIGIYGITSDSRMNYPSLVVFAVISPTQVYAQAGPGGTIPSLTVGPYNNQGFLYYRPSMGYAQEGVAEIFENATATQASLYIRADAGDALPSGTAAGNQSVTVGTTASVQVINASYTYAFNPTTEYKLQLQADRATFFDYGVDGTGNSSTRQNRTSVVPTLSKTYKLRFRCTNNKGLTVPTAKIVSASKAGTTTATITTATPHGLTTGDFITTNGIRNGTDFPPGVSAQVVSTPTSTTFTVVMTATTPTVTSYGGFVARVQGGNVPTGFVGGTGGAVQTATLTATELTLVTAGTTPVSIGDYVNVYGVRDATVGADLGVDGVYKVVNAVTTTITLIPIAGTTLPAPFTVTNCGGAIIKRTDTRISYARIFQYLRERVEFLNKSDSYSSVPVITTGTVTVTGSTTPISSNVYTLQTSTNLASSATYTGSTLNAASSTTSTTQYNTQLVIGVSHTAGLTPGQLYLDVGTETSSTTPTVWYQALAVPIPSNANWQQFTVPMSTRYYRVRFVNGATAQTNFRLSTFLQYNGGGLSNALSFPINLQYPLSTTALAANGVFTGVTMDFGDTMNVYQTITAVAFADQASASNGFQIQISRDGTNWRTSQQASVTANTLTTITAHLSYRYARVVYTNGATLQGSFNLDAHVDGQ